MKILHFILGKANKERANGVNQVVAGLAKYSARAGAEVRVIGKAHRVDSEGEIIQRDGFSVRAFSRWARPLREALLKDVEWSDVVHLHGVYSPWNLMVARLCRRRSRPYVVTLHDGLAPERAEARGRFRKWGFRLLLDRSYLERAAGIHVLTPEEATDLFAVANPSNVFCVPNGIDLDDYPSQLPTVGARMEPFVMGYLGRISPEKNLEALCMAFLTLNEEAGGMRLRIAGPESEFSRRLQARFSSDFIEWVGPKFGADKTAFIRSLDLFVHPSLCEVFSIAAMEVLALGTPLLITRTSKTSYFYDARAFFMCEPTPYGLEHGLREAMMKRGEWADRAAHGRALIERRLNWSVAARDMLADYVRIAGDGE